MIALPLIFALLGQTTPSVSGPTNTVPQTPLPVAIVQQIPPCTAGSLYLTTDGEEGAFNGMSHSGTLLVLRNQGPNACRLLPMPQATLLDTNGKLMEPFSTTVPTGRFLHPGPVVLPLAIASGAEITARMRWVSGPVFADSVCFDPSVLVLRFGELIVKTAMGGHLCGDRAKGVSAELSRFTPDPIVRKQ